MDAEQLAEIVVALKDHADALRELLADVNGLKATLTGHDRIEFDRARKRFLDDTAASSKANSDVFDSMIAQLRK
jgi:hypothetical protein